jgi:hypothetical protein
VMAVGSRPEALGSEGGLTARLELSHLAATD